MGFFDKLFSAFKKTGKDVEGGLEEVGKVVIEKAGELKDIAADKMEDMAPAIEKAKETISEKLEDAGEVLSDAKDKATAKFEEFTDAADKDAKETAEKGDNLEELMENSHLDALKNTKLTAEHDGQPIEDAVTERIDELKGQTPTANTAKNEYDQELVLPDLPDTEATGEPVAEKSDEIEGLIEAADVEEVVADATPPTVEGLTEKVDAAKESVNEKVQEAKDGLTDNLESAKENIAGVGAGIAGGAANLKDKAEEALGADLPTTEGLTEKVDKAKESMEEKVQEAKDGLAEKVDEAKESMEEKVQEAKDGLAEKVDEAKESMEEKLQEAKDGLADKVDEAKGKIAGVGAGIAGAAGGLGATDLKDKAEEVLGDTTAKLDETVSKAKELGSELEEQANAIKEKHLKAVEDIQPEAIDEVEEIEAISEEPKEIDPNEEPSFRDLVDDAKDALFGLKDSIDKKID